MLGKGALLSAEPGAGAGPLHEGPRTTQGNGHLLGSPKDTELPLGRRRRSQEIHQGLGDRGLPGCQGPEHLSEATYSAFSVEAGARVKRVLLRTLCDGCLLQDVTLHVVNRGRPGGQLRTQPGARDMSRCTSVCLGSTRSCLQFPVPKS